MMHRGRLPCRVRSAAPPQVVQKRSSCVSPEVTMRRVPLIVLLLSAGVCGSVRADVKAGQQALQKGAWVEAEAEFKSSLTVEKGPALLGLAQVYLTTGRYDEALQQ